MTLLRLRWIALVAVVGLVAVLEYARFVLAPDLLSLGGSLLFDAVVVACVVFFLAAAFRVFEEMQGRVEQQNRELIALHEAGLRISTELAPKAVLQAVVDRARDLLDARYGALALYDSDRRVHSFLTSGIDEEQRRRMGAPPTGRGVLGVTLERDSPLRLADLATHPESAGFPAGHPPMRSLLAAPIVCMAPLRGNLYLTDKLGGGSFTENDEQTIVRFATQSAIAIDNAYLHRRIEELAAAAERQRIAHEIHDGLAQVLAYVNTKSQAVGEYLRAGDVERARTELDDLAVAARDVYGDTREAILGLRSLSVAGRPFEESVREYLESWQARTAIDTAFHVEGDIGAPPTVEAQLMRIVQEALTNVRKHAQAKSVAVRLAQGNGDLSVLVEDDGKGFDADAPLRDGLPHFGLDTMRERAERAGGLLTIDSEPGRGTRVMVTFAIAPRPRGEERPFVS